MNTILEKLFKQFCLSEKDIYEIKQIYSLLSYEKEQILISNFELIAEKIKNIQEDLEKEREILIGTTIEDIKNVINLVKSEIN